MEGSSLRLAPHPTRLMTRRLLPIMLLPVLVSCDDLFTDPDEPQVVSGEAQVVRDVPTSLYVGVTHRLRVLAPDGDAGEVDVSRAATSSADAQVERRSNTELDVLPESAGGLVLELGDAAGETLGRVTFKVKRVPDPLARGDLYLFTGIRAACPGDESDRMINSLTFCIQ